MILNNFLISMRFCCFVCSSHLSFPCLSWMITLPSAWLCFSASTLAFAILCHAEASCALFYPVPYSSWTLGKRSKRPVCASALPHLPCKYGNPIGHRVVIYPWVFLLPVWLELQLFTRNGTFAARNWVTSVSSDSVVDETLEVDCCGCVRFASLHSDLSLPTSFPSWLFISVDIESSPASLVTLLTAVVSG